MSPPLFTITDAAATQIKKLLCKRNKDSAGIRIGIRKRGCSGNSYTLEFADEHYPHDEVLESQGVKIFIDPKAVLFVIGTEMDFVDEKVKSGFVFRNPNAKGECGCGESFHI